MSQLHFLWPLSGGLLIGLSAGLFLLLNGRVAGVSGLTAVAAGLSKSAPRGLALGFLAAVVAGAALAAALVRRPEMQVTGDLWLLVAGGLLVGFGSRLGAGCTSGHGVCGLARLSPRSMAATGVFMGVAAIVVFVVRHLTGAF